MDIKSSQRETYHLNEKDVIMDNGAVIQITSRKFWTRGHHWSYPTVGKKRWSEYLKTGAFELYHRKNAGSPYEVRYYRLKETSQ